ncbi:MAG: hypothetical protein CL902_13285 [Dehalococcoidia bacterium]|nr:hypothetical protein [Dehalococcoidia bacterium]
MIRPPWLLHLRVKGKNRGFRLAFPLFVIWPFLLLTAVLLAPIVLTLAVVFWSTGWRRPMLSSGPRFFTMFCALRGLEIDVQNQDKHVYLSIR